MKSLLDGSADLFHSVPMWMCPSCGRTVTLPFGTSTSLPEHRICQCAGYIGNDGQFHGHFTEMVPNEAGRKLDEGLERWITERRETEKKDEEQRVARRFASNLRWGRIYQDLADVDEWRTLALPFVTLALQEQP